MKNFSYAIKDEVGIHARPAGILVKEAKKYQSKIVVVKDGKKAEATKSKHSLKATCSVQRRGRQIMYVRPVQ